MAKSQPTYTIHDLSEFKKICCLSGGFLKDRQELKKKLHIFKTFLLDSEAPERVLEFGTNYTWIWDNWSDNLYKPHGEIRRSRRNRIPSYISIIQGSSDNEWAGSFTSSRHVSANLFDIYRYNDFKTSDLHLSEFKTNYNSGTGIPKKDIFSVKMTFYNTNYKPPKKARDSRIRYTVLYVDYNIKHNRMYIYLETFNKFKNMPMSDYHNLLNVNTIKNILSDYIKYLLCSPR